MHWNRFTQFLHVVVCIVTTRTRWCYLLLRHRLAVQFSGLIFHFQLSQSTQLNVRSYNSSCAVKILTIPSLSNRIDFKWVHRIFLSSALTVLSFSHCHARQTTVVADGADLIAATSVSDIKLCAPNWQRGFLHLRSPHANELWCGPTPQLTSLCGGHQRRKVSFLLEYVVI